MINATFDVETGKIKRIYASARYPSEQLGNIFYDSEIIPNLKFAEKLPKDLECIHAVVAFRASHILLSRDLLGGKPLYYDQTGISSFSSYLNNPKEVLPGEIVKIDYEGKVLEKRIYKFEEVIKKDEKNLEEIEEEILQEIEDLKLENYCIAFSGGIDSALLASIHDLPLISITANEKEEEWVKKVAKELSRDLEVFRIREEEIKYEIQEVSKTIETSNFLQLSIAIPIHFTMKFAKRRGFDGIVFGQGADELFGGYKRYENYSRVELEKAMLEDLKNIGNKNLVRDAKLSYQNEIKLILPYLRWRILRNSLSIPIELKVARIEGKIVRKYFLRKIAQKYLSEEVVWREKKAIQYSTGVVKILKKLGYSQTGKDLGS
ncbi:MAG: asparagine synthase-related protein [Archaeoglobaceae archaeon]|nr:asparagine synthase-related protein [Archaeoglobaceae archaeon]MDW8118192.1 asparagine synthase-related protein [Archaeoglobaceae archaeon]